MNDDSARNAYALCARKRIWIMLFTYFRDQTNTYAKCETMCTYVCVYVKLNSHWLRMCATLFRPSKFSLSLYVDVYSSPSFARQSFCSKRNFIIYTQPNARAYFINMFEQINTRIYTHKTALYIQFVFSILDSAACDVASTRRRLMFAHNTRHYRCVCVCVCLRWSLFNKQMYLLYSQIHCL